MAELSIIIAADIFGVSQEFEGLCQKISHVDIGKHTVNYHMVGPYKEQPTNFLSEKDAYQYFIQRSEIDNSGEGSIENALAAYSQKLLNEIEKISGPKLLIGFSVGGSALWQLMPHIVTQKVLSATCFYSGQIRHMTDVIPTVPCRLIFPKSEKHFSVNKLIASLKTKYATSQFTVDVEQSEHQHGFLNKLSSHYDKIAANKHIVFLQQTISQALAK